VRAQPQDWQEFQAQENYVQIAAELADQFGIIQPFRLVLEDTLQDFASKISSSLHQGKTA
jgi:hypothetical protein